MTPPTRVFLTIDVECAEERVIDGRFQPAMGFDLRVWGRFRNHQRELGLRYILDELDGQGLAATFFVEPLGARHFGVTGLREVCREIRDRGHDVQLHLHPVQRLPDWHSRGQPRASDDMADYSEGDQAALLQEGRAALAAAGVPADSILAFRAGNFGANNDTWRALAATGFRVDSSFNPCYFDRNCRMRTPAAAAGLFPSEVPGVWELPVTCFVEPPASRRRVRHLQVTAVSVSEIIDVLAQSRALGLGEITIVTHSFEFCFIDSPEKGTGRPNPVTIGRWRKLLRYLRDHPDDYRVQTVGELARSLPGSAARPCTELPRGRVALRLGRHVDQAYKRALAWIR